MTKIAVITDTHFGARSDNIYLLQYQKKFYDDVFFPTLEKEGIDVVWHLGDVFDRRKFINFNTLQMAKDMFFEPLKQRGIEMNIILGNHDIYFKNTNSTNSPSLLLKDYNFNLFEAPEYVTIDGETVLLLPWITPESYDKSISMITEAKARFIFGHLEVKGIEEIKGHISDHGFSQSMFDPYLTVFSGHFHFRSNTNGIMYLGNPYQTTWSDFDVEKGFHILDLKTQDVQFIRNPYALFQKIIYDDTTDMTGLDIDGLEGSYVRVVVRNKKSPYEFDKFMDRLSNAKPNNVIVMDESILKSETLTQDDDLEIEDTLTLIDRHLSNTNIKNKDGVNRLMRELYNQAIDLDMS